MKLEDLKLMDIEQLRTIHDNIGLPYHHKSGKDKLISAIVLATNNVAEPPRNGAAPHNSERHTATQTLKPEKISSYSTEYPTAEQVKEGLEPFLQRGVEIVSLDDEGFHFRRGAKEDSGTLKQPLRRILEAAQRLVH